MNVDFADEEMIAYRESLIEKKKEQPFWKKKCLSVNETAAYTGIGRGKIRELMKRKDCNFMKTDDYQVYVIMLFGKLNAAVSIRLKRVFQST